MRNHSFGINLAARKGGILVLATAAWLVSCYANPLLFKLYHGSLDAPHLTNLANVPWYPGGHHGSSAGQIGVALAIAAFAAVLAEMAKCLSAAPGAFRIYLGAMGFQGIVVGATLAHGSAEWAEHFVSLTFTQGSRYISWHSRVFEPSWPWLPIVALLILMGLTLFHWREPREAGAGDQPGRFRWVGSWSSLALVGMAWFCGALARQLTDLWIPTSYRAPHMGNVAAVPWDPAGEPQSTTVQLFGALFFAVLGVLLVEIVKALQIRHGRRAAYWPLLAFQAVLFCDVFASAAPDWAGYALTSILGVVVPAEAFPSWPWISLLALFLLLLPDLRKRTS